MKFQGKITSVSTPRTGEGKNGEWASVQFEVTETNPSNPSYPQIAGFDMFKSGDYIDYAKDFVNKYPIGTVVEVDFQFGKTTYQKKDGSGEGVFYKNNAFKVDVLNVAAPQPSANNIIDPKPTQVVSEDDLPF